LSLLGVHGASFIAAIVFVIVLMFGRHGFRWNRPAPTSIAETTPTCSYVSGSTREWHGPAVPAVPPPSPPTIIASYPEEETARAQFDALTSELPPNATLRLFGQTLILTLPNEKGEAIRRWSDRLKKQIDNVMVARKLYFMGIRLSCQAPSEEEAKFVEEELQLYSHSQNRMILPPWSAAWESLPEETQQRFRKARRTLVRFEKIKVEVSRNPDVKALRKQLIADRDPNDDAANKKAIEALARLREDEEQRLLADLAKEDEKTVDHAMLELCKRHSRLMKENSKFDDEENEATPEAKALAKQRAALNKEIAERMGALPLQHDQPEPGSDLESGRPGRASRKGLSISVENVTFRDITRGLPALAEWLSRRGCRQIEYSIQIRNFPMGEENDSRP